ncbi:MULTISPECIES: MerR family transcriptional regulator [Vagococcus]|uniref:Transcriptional regulator, MerR family n=1 Tax=Vagococcus fluvialis bH819 TaxID=1255619 RepID=A0A1X6WQV1_9ENTE|nr:MULTISPECIES: MerR family transcriptional regulator [Vagococcus]SLM86660.1 Transcriptional regulator, MerR family [Vagococcus fluvialis bH819]
MSKYTTGEIAKFCDVSVRTVQFYDTKKILTPTELTQSGRRLYSDEDVKKLQFICLLKSLGLNLASIKDILSSGYATSTLLLIFDEQSKQLEVEVKEKQVQIEAMSTIRTILENCETIPTEILTDIEHIMKDTKKLKKVHYVMIVTAVVCGLIQYSTFIFGITKGVWQPFLFGMSLVITLTIWFTWYYRKNINYICPKCHNIFYPSFSQFVFAKHTFKTRKLKCCNCSHISYCVETTAEITKVDN